MIYRLCHFWGLSVRLSRSSEHEFIFFDSFDIPYNIGRDSGPFWQRNAILRRGALKTLN